MSVKTVPVQHAEVDYAEMCAALQAKVHLWRILRLCFLFCLFGQNFDNFNTSIFVFKSICVIFCICCFLLGQVNEMEGVTTQRLLQQQEGYEETIRELRNQVSVCCKHLIFCDDCVS